MNLSKNFTEAEFLKSATAQIKGINNTWDSPMHKANAIRLCKEVLQPLRDKFGAIRITSGYRNKVLNKAVGGAKHSKHLTGEAADIFPLNPNVTLQQIYDYLEPIHKGGLAMKKNSFIHVDICESPLRRRWAY